MSLPAAPLRRPVSTVAATLAVILLGAVSLGRMPVSLLPDVSLPVLTIRTTRPGAAALEVSRQVAEPIEEAIAATPGLVELHSVSRNSEPPQTRGSPLWFREPHQAAGGAGITPNSRPQADPLPGSWERNRLRPWPDRLR